MHTPDNECSNPSTGPRFEELLDQVISRRMVLRRGIGAAALPFLAGLGACGGDNDGGAGLATSPAGTGSGTSAPPAAPASGFSFKAVTTSSADTVVVPEGYTAQVLLRWGDPMTIAAPAFKGDASETWNEQELQYGDNQDGMHFFGFREAGGSERSDAGLIAVNHEYFNPEYFYVPGNDADDWLEPWTADKAKKSQAAHGLSVFEVRKRADGAWEHVRSSGYNRRITAYTPMSLTGPAAGVAALRTAADPAGTTVLGTINNCANGWTPWGTYLTCEENFNGVFGWNGTRTSTALENRYGITQAGFSYRWHEVDPRFDVAATPNEPNRFGWVVELDPFDPTSTPRKHTALGRFKHENAALVVAANRKVVVYMGDDERNEYIYKFISDGTYDAAAPASAARDLLTAGTLYVAKFEAGPTTGDRAGTGRWIPLVFGQNGLDASNGFSSQADVLINARKAGDVVGATMMDRPEWVVANPKKPGEVYATLTNNNRRGSTPPSSNKPDGTTAAGAARPPIDEANPRANNVWGHIIRWNEAAGDPTASTFTWDIYLLAGNPKKYPDRTDPRSGSSSITTDNMFNSPDGLGFDPSGRLWIQTDGTFSNSGEYDGQGNNQLLVSDVTTGEVKRFMVGPSGCEITGITWSPDGKVVFVNIQHPGELASHPRAASINARFAAITDTAARDLAILNYVARHPVEFSTWPDGAQATRPRAATLAIRRNDGGVVGS